MTHLTTIVFLYRHSEDSQITGRNMLVNILQINKNISQNLSAFFGFL